MTSTIGEYDLGYYQQTIQGNFDKSPSLLLRWTFKAIDICIYMKGNNHILYDKGVTIFTNLPKMHHPPYDPRDDTMMPYLNIMDHIREILWIDSNLHVYYLRKQEYLYTRIYDYILTPLSCTGKEHRHKVTHMEAAEGMVFCQTCGRILTDKEIKSYKPV